MLRPARAPPSHHPSDYREIDPFTGARLAPHGLAAYEDTGQETFWFAPDWACAVKLTTAWTYDGTSNHSVRAVQHPDPVGYAVQRILKMQKFPDVIERARTYALTLVQPDSMLHCRTMADYFEAYYRDQHTAARVHQAKQMRNREDIDRAIAALRLQAEQTRELANAQAAELEKQAQNLERLFFDATDISI